MNSTHQIKVMSHRQYEFNVDIALETNQPLFNSSDKTIYKLKWMKEQNPAIVLIEIKGAEAIREVSFCLYFSCHPHIVRTFGLVNYQSDSMFLVQEYAPDGDLAELLRERRFIPSEDVLVEIFVQICDAMICLADNGIVHGDLACRNILVFRSHPTKLTKNLVKLTDFGLARGNTIYSIDSHIASSTNIVVPIRYAAPEILQTMDAKNYSEKSDVYSMGVLMWEALSADKIPYFFIENDDEVRHQKLKGNTLSQPKCSEDLWNIINDCWHQSPECRHDFRSLKQSLLMIQLGKQVKKRETNTNDLSNKLNSMAMPTKSRFENPISRFKCSFCKEIFTTETEKNSHMNSCGSKTEQCSYCSQYILRAEFVYHQDHCSTNNSVVRQLNRPTTTTTATGEALLRANTNDDSAFGRQRNLQQFSSMRVKPRQKTVECDFCQGDYDISELENHKKNCFLKHYGLPIQHSIDPVVQRRPKLLNQNQNHRHTLSNIPESTSVLKEDSPESFLL